MEDNKKKNGFRFILVILCMIVFALIGCAIGWFAYDVFNGVDNVEGDNARNDSSNAVVIENLDVLSDVVQNNLKKFMSASDYYCGTASLYFKNEKVSVSDIDNKLAYLTVSKEFFANNGSVSSDAFLEKVEEYFGSDYNYQHQSYPACSNHNYNSATNSYEYVETACGGVCGPFRVLYSVSKAYIEGDLLILNVKVLFPGTDNSLNERGYHKYYSDANLTKEIKDLDYQVVNVPPSEASVLETDANFAKGGDYTFTMKKVKDNIYSFVSSEKR